MAIVQKERVDKITGCIGTRLYPLAQIAKSDLNFAQVDFDLAQLQARTLPLVLKNLAVHLNDPAIQGRPITLNSSHILEGIPTDKYGSIIDDAHGQIYSKVSAMVSAVMQTIEFAEAVSGRWLVSNSSGALLFFRVGSDFDTTIAELIECGTIYTPPKKAKKSKKSL